jgi:hypothetical protein
VYQTPGLSTACAPPYLCAGDVAVALHNKPRPQLIRTWPVFRTHRLEAADLLCSPACEAPVAFCRRPSPPQSDTVTARVSCNDNQEPTEQDNVLAGNHNSNKWISYATCGGTNPAIKQYLQNWDHNDAKQNDKNPAQIRTTDQDFKK